MAIARNAIPVPLQDPIARPKREEFKGRKDPLEGHVTTRWAEYFIQWGLTSELAPSQVGLPVALTNQNASIAAVDFSGGDLPAGLYRITYYARITQAATTSSSLTVTLNWTDGGVSPSFSGAAITGNTVTTIQSETKMVRADALSPIRYATVYSSSGATPMLYSLDVKLERMPA